MRFIRSGTRVSPDPLRVSPGRGINLHPTRHCIELALKKRAFERGLGVSAGTELTEDFIHQLNDALLTALEHCVRNGVGSGRPQLAHPSEGWVGPGTVKPSQFHSKRLRERFHWLRQCLDEFTFAQANGRSRSFATGYSV